MAALGHTGRLHCELSPSSAYRWTACPGSVQLLRKVPKGKSSAYADEGTAAHEFAEGFLRDEVGTSIPLDYIGEKLYTPSGQQIVIDQEFAEAVQVYVEYCQRLMVMSSWDAVERPITLGPIDPPAPMFGTADYVAVVGTTLHVVDLKFGRGVLVEAVGNLQALYYALGAFLSLDPDRAKPLREVTITIVQPRAEHRDGHVRSWTLPVEDLLDQALGLFDAAKRALAPGAPLTAGKHCRFCAAQGVCPEASRTALEVARNEFGVIDTLTPPAPQTLSLEQIAELMGKFDDVEKWMSAVRAYAQEAAERGETLPGWKLVERRANRKWSSEAELKKWGEDAGVCVYSDPEVMSPAQLEKSLGKANKHLFPADLVVRQSSGLSLAPEWDKRPAVHAVPATAEFSAIEQGE